MSGITTGIGIFSGIDTGSLIEQLLAIESRPRILAQQRMIQLQLQQSAYMDVNSKLQALKSAAAGFRTGNIFAANKSSSSDPNVLTATATSKAAQGAYTFIVDRLVTTQQQLSKGFADSDQSGLGASSFTFESALGRVDRDIALADLNGGEGVARGTIQVTDSDGTVATVDLSRAATVSEVLEAINSSAARVTASVQGGRFVVSDDQGGSITIANGSNSTTADSLGIAGTAPGGTLTGSLVYAMTEAMALKGLNDGNGVYIGNQAGGAGYDFRISVGGAWVNVNLGDVWETVDDELKVTAPAASTVGGVIDRIDAALDEAGFSEVTTSVSADGTRLVLTDGLGRMLETADNEATSGNTLADLGLATSAPVAGTVTGKQVLAEINSTLTRNLLGGGGALGDGALSFTLRNGHAFNVTADLDSSIAAMGRQIEAAAGTNVDGSKRLLVTLNEAGDGLLLTDNTGGGGNLIIEGNDAGPDTDTAAALGISTGPAGIASSTVESGNLQHAYVSLSTLVSGLNNGKGIGTGTFTIFDSQGAKTDINIESDTKTVGDLISEINSKAIRVKARVNDNGDGILLYEPDGGGGNLKIKVEDDTGAVARSLGLRGEAKGTGVENVINGSAEITVEFETTDTLSDIADKINASEARVTATVINDGGGTSPFHLSLASDSSGVAGRFITRTGGLDLGLDTLDEGADARVFLGSSDPARAVLLSSSTNSLDDVIQGVNLDLVSTSADPVTITVSQDRDGILSSIGAFVETFNTAIGRIDFQSRFVPSTDETQPGDRGPLLGDGTLLSLRAELYNTILGPSQDTPGSFDRFSDVGIQVGEDGLLEFDQDVFNRAMAEDPESVEALFTAREMNSKEREEIFDGVFVEPDPDRPDTFSSLGIAGLVEQLAVRFIDTTSGILTLRNSTLADQISLQQKRVENFDSRLADRRVILQRQFLAMESAIGRLQSQQGSLSQIAQVG
jgi:flagellar hook-associated protein 2